MIKIVYVDVSITANNREHTGIQKVVRNLFYGLTNEASKRNLIIVPVRLSRAGAHALNELIRHPFEEPISLSDVSSNTSIGMFTRVRKTVWFYYSMARDWVVAREDRRVDILLLGKLARYILLLAWKLHAIFENTKPDPTITFRPNDFLILPDASWQIEPWAAIEQARAAKAQVVAVWHDVIPLELPDSFDKTMVKKFEKNFEGIFSMVDTVFCVSAATSKSIVKQLTIRCIPVPNLNVIWPEVRVAAPSLNPPLRLKRALADPAVIIVGTIEPRKGHELLLDAAEILWRENLQFNVIFIGRIGWKVIPLVQRYKLHKEADTRLHVFHGLTDSEVVYAMDHASVLTLPSCAEGFGLPIAEAELCGCPVVCSDIQVFREIASPEAILFSPYTSVALSDALRPFLIKGGPRRTRHPHKKAHTGQPQNEYARKFLDLLLASEVGS